MNDVKPLEIGTNVKFGTNFEFRGEITAICIRETSNTENKTTTYEISYWKDTELKTIWLYERNLKIVKNKQMEIGFINEEIS